MSLYYLVKSGCSKFLPNTGFVIIRLLRFGVKVKRAYCRDNFLAQRPPLPDMRRLSGDDFVMFQQDGTGASARDTVAFLERQRDARNASSYAFVSIFTGHISSTNSDNFEPICHNN